MDRGAKAPSRKPGVSGHVGPSTHRPHSLPLCCRRAWKAASRRGNPCSALSEGGSQGASAALNPTLLGDAKAQIEFGEEPHARSAHGSVKGERERVNAGDLLQSSSQASWDEWLRHFDTMDELAEDAAHYQVELDSAVKQERYGDATRFKRKVQEIQAADTVAAIQRQLQANLAAEQYGAAAELRDRGLVGLAGWWAGKDGADDFQGHLLHVKPEFGRWTGRIYTARDIAALDGWMEHKLGQQRDRASGSERGAFGLSSSAAVRGLEGGGSSAAGLGGGTIGTPMIEVFVRQQQAGPQQQSGLAASGEQQQLVPGLLVHQAVALRPPAPKAGKDGRQGQGQAGGAQVKLNPAMVVRLCIHVARDGSARISVLPPKPVKSEFNSWEEEEMRATMAALAGDSLKPAAPRAAPPRGASAARASSDGEFQRPGDEDDDDDYLTELTRIPAQVVLQGRDRFTFTVLEEGAATPSSSASSSGASGGAVGASEEADSDTYASGSGVDLPRWAAVPIDDDDDEEAGGVAAAAQQRLASPSPSAAAAAGTGTASAAGTAAEGAPVAEVRVALPDAAEQAGAPSGRRSLLDAADEEAAAAAEAAALGNLEGVSDDEDEAAVTVSLEALSVGYGKLDAVATSVKDGVEQSITIEIPVRRLMQQQQRDADARRRGSGAAAGSSGRHGKDTFDRLAERVAQLQAARAGRPVPPENLATALRTLAQRLVAGELAADGSSDATATVPSAAAASALKATTAARRASGNSSSASAAAAAAKPPQLGASRITYARIPTDLPRTDPFCGLYLGAFGPHGPELIHLSRATQDGEEVVFATKVTGDPNVPAGEVSFRAKVGRRHRLDSRDVYPEELGIMARYKGEGRVAMAGYKSPRWVDGELLVFKSGASPYTNGAELGFVWSVPGEKRFLILLNKLDLKECEK